MRIAYLTVDDVNPALARRWAKRLGARVVRPRPTRPTPRADALVIDFDHLPVELCRKWVNGVLLRTERRPVLVHGYNIPQPVADALRLRGATVVCGRLGRRGWADWLRPMTVRPAAVAA